MELGCGSGSLIGLLAVPACSLDEFPSASALDYLKSKRASTDDLARLERLRKIEDILRGTPELEVYQRDLHLQVLIGLDLDPERLQYARTLNQDPHQSLSSSSFPPPSRWEPLRVELWHGNLAVKNERFVGIECIIMSEVIEHLYQSDIDRSIPLLFGHYRPQWIIITTPNYEFNRHIDQYSTPESRRDHRFLDPTGRTDRYFRDSDHKFEWTRDEFNHWCQSISSTYDYDHHITGCGSYKNYFYQSVNRTDSSEPNPQFPLPTLPVPEHPERFFATQIVIFHRRSHNTTPSGFDPQKESPSKRPDQDQGCLRQELIIVEEHPADQSAQQVSKESEVLDHVKRYLIRTQTTRVQLRELWLCDSGLDKLCGGKLIELLISFSFEAGWELELDPATHRAKNRWSPTGMDAIWITWLNFPSSRKKSYTQRDCLH